MSPKQENHNYYIALKSIIGDIYKTKTEPNLLSEIMVDGEEDSIAKIRKEFGIEEETRKYYMLLLLVETSGGATSHHEEPNKY